MLTIVLKSLSLIGSYSFTSRFALRIVGKVSQCPTGISVSSTSGKLLFKASGATKIDRPVASAAVDSRLLCFIIAPLKCNCFLFFLRILEF